jgi:WD repeat-containing protein 6
MDQPFQITHSCLPVTALQTLRLTHNLLLFSAQGPFLSVIDVESEETLSYQRVFASSTIHGVTCNYSPAHTGTRTLLIWGASSICFARLNLDEHRLLPFQPYSGPGQELIIGGLEIGETINVPDRILDASFACDASSADVQACLVTAHNELLLLRFGRSRLSLHLRTDLLHVSPTISRISTGEEPLLYSARVQSFTPGTFQVVAGTAFGKILVWFIPASHNHGDTHKLIEVGTGHKGATFGVDQFDEWLASCSDDRGIRIGVDLSELLVPQPADTNNTQPVRLDNGCWEMVERWRHTSRVWGVKFITIVSSVYDL